MKKFGYRFAAIIMAITSINCFAGCSSTGTNETTEHTDEPEVPAHTHQYVSEVIAPTCQEQGYTLHTCSCGDEYKDNYTPVVNHTGIGNCSSCGLDFYEAFQNFMVESGELTDEDYSDYFTEQCYWFDYIIDEEISTDLVSYDIVFLPTTNMIIAKMTVTSIGGDFSTGIMMEQLETELAFEDAKGEYPWDYAINGNYVGGILNAISGNLSYSDSVFGDNTTAVVQQAVPNLLHILNVIDRIFTEHNLNFSMENFGFHDYQE